MGLSKKYKFMTYLILFCFLFLNCAFLVSAAPTITINSPLNSKIYNTLTPPLDITSDGVATWYSLNNGANATYITPTTITAVEGSNTLTVWSNDSSNVVSSSTSTFTVDVTAPTITITYPTATTYGSAVTSLNYTTSGSGVDSCWYSLNNGQTNISVSCGTNVAGITSAEGSNTWKIWINDTANNVNSASVSFTVNSAPPQIQISSPTNTTYTNRTILVNIASTGASNVWYNWNGTNISYSTSILVTFNQGSNTLTTWANDSSGHLNSTSVTFSVNVSAPSINVNTPASNSYAHANFPISINVTGDSVDSSKVYYRWENSSSNSQWYQLTVSTAPSFAGTFDMSTLADGAYTLRFNATNTFGNTNSGTTVSLTKDTVTPNITGNITITTTTSGATMTFTSSESANASIHYGLTAGSLTSVKDFGDFITSHIRALTSLDSGTTYYYQLTYRDMAANCNTASGSFDTNSLTGSGSSSSSSSGGGGGGGGSPGTAGSDLPTASTIWSILNGGSPNIFNVNKPDIAVNSVSVTPSETINAVKLTVRQLKSQPTNVARTPVGNVYKYLEFMKENIQNNQIKNAVINFRVEKSWVTSAKGDKNNVVLYRANGDIWASLPTKLVQETSENYVYEATSPGFSYFAIALQTPEQQKQQDKQNIDVLKNAAANGTANGLAENLTINAENSVDDLALIKNTNWWLVIGVLVALLVFSVGGFIAYKYKDKFKVKSSKGYQYRPHHGFLDNKKDDEEPKKEEPKEDLRTQFKDTHKVIGSANSGDHIKK